MSVTLQLRMRIPFFFRTEKSFDKAAFANSALKATWKSLWPGL